MGYVIAKNGFAAVTYVFNLRPVFNPWLIVEMLPACLSLFYRHYFGTCSSELTQLVPLPYS